MGQKASGHPRITTGSFALVAGATAAAIVVPGMTDKSTVLLNPTAAGAGVAGTRYIVTKAAGQFTVAAVDNAGAAVNTDVTTFDYAVITDPAQS